jgi:hypothetical protein
MSYKYVRVAIILAIAVVLAFAVPALGKGKPVDPGGGGGHTETATNNLSFPAIAVDGYLITLLAEPSFVDIYDGSYPGLDDAQLALVLGKDMYAQKDPDGDGLINTWQADYLSQSAVDVDVIDWGDNIESVDAFVRRPFRLEVVLFDNTLSAPMTGYNMALLEYPSSPDEVQGTDTTTYEGTSATVISSKPKLVIQALGDADPTALTWDVDSSRWLNGTAVLPTTPIGFAPELNVAGKYIYGASTGGWKPTVAGVYRVTFYIPTDSGVNLRLAEIAVSAEEEVTAEAEEGGGATPVIDRTNNLTYVDITVQPRNR